MAIVTPGNYAMTSLVRQLHSGSISIDTKKRHSVTEAQSSWTEVKLSQIRNDVITGLKVAIFVPSSFRQDFSQASEVVDHAVLLRYIEPEEMVDAPNLSGKPILVLEILVEIKKLVDEQVFLRTGRREIFKSVA